MTDQHKPKQNAGNETTVHNPKPADQVEKVDPTTGGSAGTIDTGDTSKE